MENLEEIRKKIVEYIWRIDEEHMKCHIQNNNYYFEKLMESIKKTNLLKDTKKITVYTSFLNKALVSSFIYIVNDRGDEFFAPYLPTTILTSGAVNTKDLLGLIWGEEETFNFVENLCNELSQNGKIEITNIYMPYALHYVLFDNIYEDNLSYFMSEDFGKEKDLEFERLKTLKKWIKDYKEKYNEINEKRKEYNCNYYDYLYLLFINMFPNSNIVKKIEEVTHYSNLYEHLFKMKSEYKYLEDEKNQEICDKYQRIYMDKMQETYNNINKDYKNWTM